MDKINNLFGKSAADILKETGQENCIPANLNQILRYYEISAIATDFSELEKSLSVVTSREPARILGAMITLPASGKAHEFIRGLKASECT